MVETLSRFVFLRRACCCLSLKVIEDGHVDDEAIRCVIPIICAD
ncbi:hypothetical protein [Sorlinia euscelidii]